MITNREERSRERDARRRLSYPIASRGRNAEKPLETIDSHDDAELLPRRLRNATRSRRLAPLPLREPRRIAEIRFDLLSRLRFAIPPVASRGTIAPRSASSAMTQEVVYDIIARGFNKVFYTRFTDRYLIFPPSLPADFGNCRE